MPAGPGYFFWLSAGVAGAAGGAVCAGVTWIGLPLVVPGSAFWKIAGEDLLFRVEIKDSESDVNINKAAAMVVAFDNTVAEPRGPNTVWEPMPPNAPARSAALPLCSSTTIARNKQTITCTIVIKMTIWGIQRTNLRTS